MITFLHSNHTDMRIIAILFTYMLAVPLQSYCQTDANANNTPLVVLGWVLGGNDNNMLQNATVVLTNTALRHTDTLVTRSDGTYSFRLEPNTNYTLQAFKDQAAATPISLCTDATTKPIQYVNIWVKSTQLPISIGKVSTNNNDTTVLPAELLNNAVTYSVQLGIYTQKPSIYSLYLAPVKDEVIFEPLDDEMGYRAVVGAFADYTKAETYFQKIVEIGYKDAKVVAFWGNKYVEIPATTVLKFVENH